jgi:hypothetical protein
LWGARALPSLPHRETFIGLALKGDVQLPQQSASVRFERDVFEGFERRNRVKLAESLQKPAEEQASERAACSDARTAAGRAPLPSP